MDASMTFSDFILSTTGNGIKTHYSLSTASTEGTKVHAVRQRSARTTGRAFDTSWDEMAGPSLCTTSSS